MPFRRLFAELPTRLIFEAARDEVILSQEENGERQALGRYHLQALDGDSLMKQVPKAKREQVVLRLQNGRVLSKVISLPLAAEANLRQVVGFEIDRLTPFSLDQVYYDVHVLERQPAARRIRVRFTVTPRPIVDVFLNQLAENGLPADAVDVIGCEDQVNLLPEEKKPRKSRVAQRVRWALVILAFVLLVAASFLPLWQQRSVVLALLPEVNAAQKQAEQIFTLREDLVNSVESSRFLLEKKQEMPLVIELLSELTSILPDDTWVEQLEVKDKKVQIRGQSRNASALIGVVEASEFFQNATFLSPITADRRTERDRFFLSAQIVRES